jgi:multidrug resistance efflux pump
VDERAKTSRPALNRRLDPSEFQAQLLQANATGMSAQASQQAARANIDHGDAAVKDTQTTAGLARKLVEAGAAPAMNLPSAAAALAETNAQKQQAIAQLNQAKAQAQASRSQVSQGCRPRRGRPLFDVAQVNPEPVP